jgi:alpha-tubulin suppressor-like RCC1 family protein
VSPTTRVLTTGTSLLIAGVRIAAIAAGNQHSLALSEDGKVFAWGHGQFGALGLGQGGTNRTLSMHTCDCQQKGALQGSLH